MYIVFKSINLTLHFNNNIANSLILFIHNLAKSLKILFLKSNSKILKHNDF